MTVKPDGTVAAEFREVGKEDAPGLSNEAEHRLAEYCYLTNTEPEHHMRDVRCKEAGARSGNGRKKKK